MSLIFNHSRYHAYPQNFFGLGVAQVITNKDVNNMSKYGFSSLSDFPSGYGFEGYMGANKAGGMGASRFFEVTASGSGSMGINIEATSDLSFFFGDAYGDLIVSGEGTASFEVTTTGNVIAGLFGIASSSISFTASNNSVFADGYASAQLDIATSGQGQLTAIAVCGGNSVDVSGLTPASIWSYGDRTLTSIDIEVSGLTVEEHNKLMSTSTKSDVYNASQI